MNERREKLELLSSVVLPEASVVRQYLNSAREGFTKKIIVLDDDPTGIQTVHDLPVYTDWEPETILNGFLDNCPMFFVLTNSRSFSAEKTEEVHRKIADSIALAAKKTGKDFIVISRSDSTLRGHYPLETVTLRNTLEQTLGIHYDGEIIMPYFKEGSRYTVNNIHYVKTGDELVPAAQTEFAKDTTFAYKSSNLAEWCEEKTAGVYQAKNVTCISLQSIRSLAYDTIYQQLMNISDFGKIIVNAADDLDVEVFVSALLKAIKSGKKYLFRTAAGLVRVLGGVEPRPLLSGKEMRSSSTPGGGLIIVGSHVRKTTKQLEMLLQSKVTVHAICFDASKAYDKAELEYERSRVLKEMEENLRRGVTTVVYTSRDTLRAKSGLPADNLSLSVSISEAISSLVSDLTVKPAYLIAKGGITSSDVGVRGLHVRRAWVMGQILPGIPVWKTGKESKFPEMAYVIFPGNVGDEGSLLDAVKKLEYSE